MELDMLARHISMTAAEISTTRRLLFDSTSTTLSIPETVVLLVCDFLKETGMEQYAAAVKLCQSEIEGYAQNLTSALERHQAGKFATIPWMFISIIDNNYIGLQVTGVPTKSLGLWHIVDGTRLHNPPTPPIFTMTISIAAIFLKTVAKHYGYTEAAEAFVKGELTCRKKSES